MILEGIPSAEAQGTHENERPRFGRLDVSTGQSVQAEREFTHSKAPPRRIELSIGPARGDVSPERTNIAAGQFLYGVGDGLIGVVQFAVDRPFVETTIGLRLHRNHLSLWSPTSAAAIDPSSFPPLNPDLAA